jgi:hypothetical protein
MKLPKITIPRLVVTIAVISSVQAGSLAYQRYLRCQVKAEELAITEATYRQKGGVCEELALNLREVAALAREVAKSASTDFERSKWLEMARTEEEKAIRLNQEAVQKMIRADQLASRVNALHRVSWRPWLAEPE